MMLRSISVEQLPGIGKPFTVEGIQNGLVVVHGPNGSGKSSLCRLVASLLWRAVGGWQGAVRARAQWEIAGERIGAERIDRTVAWQNRASGEPPFAPPADHLAGFYYIQVRDLLLDKQEADQKIQEEIVKRIYGGASPATISEALFSGKKSDLLQASREYGRLERELQSRLASRRILAEEQTHELPRLEAALAAAQAAESEMKVLASALQVQDCRHALIETRRRMNEDFPPQTAAVDANDLLWFDDKTLELVALKARIAEAQAVEQRTAQEVAGIGLRQGAVDVVLLRAYSEKIRRLQTIADELRRAQEQALQADARIEQAYEHTPAADAAEAGPAQPRTPVDETALTAIERHLENAQKTLEIKARCVSAMQTFADPPQLYPRETLARGMQALWGWRAAIETNGSARLRWLKLGLALSLLTAIAALLPVLRGMVAGWGALIFATSAALTGFFALLRHGRTDGPARWKKDYLATHLPAPVQWNLVQVEKTILLLEEKLRETLQAQFHAQVREDLERQRKKADDMTAELAGERARICANYGIDPGAGNLTLMDVARRLARLRSAREEQQAAHQECDRLVQAFTALREDCAGFIATHLGRKSTDPIQLAVLMDELTQASARLDRLRVEETRAKEALTALAEELERKIRELHAFWQRFGHEQGDRHWLQLRVAHKNEWVTLADREKYLAAEMSRLTRELEDAGHGDWSALPVEELDKRLAQCKEQAAGRHDLLRRISQLHAQVEAAERSHEVGDAQAAHAQALDRLTALRETRLTHLAGARLLDVVKTEHDEVNKPEILRKADELFRLFTMQRYAIDPRGNEGELGARDTVTGEAKTLGILSEATRIQLLLAVRLAFVLGQEKAGIRLPIFFDDILATTDPERFAAIVRVMGTLVAAQDRQIFYMTADPMVPTAVSEWLRREGLPPAQVVDLGLLRELGAAVRLSEQLAVPERRRIPSPEGMTAEAYGVAVMATPFDPRSLFEEQHLYHAASGDLPLLYRLLVYGISTAGEWLSCVESRNDSRILPHEKQRRYLGAALDVTSAYLSAWLPGRGKRVSAEIIDRSPLAPSAREKVRDISLEFNGHPGKLLAHLTQKGDDRLKNLKKLGECVEYLKEICDCHEDEKLPQEAIVRQVFVSMAPNIAAGDITADEVGRLVHELWHKSPVD